VFKNLISALSFAVSISALDAAKPNIVLVMADDMGYSDIGCYGSEIETPNLDRLAGNGLRFTQFYNTSRCCPTRASLLTGLYSHQAGIGLMTGDRGYEAYRGDLNKRCVTIGEALRQGGYRTYMSGKWHVTKHVSAEGPKHNWPLQRGFDRFYGTIIGAGSFWDPATLCRDNTFITPLNDHGYQPTETFFYSDAISDNAVTYIREHEREHAGRPFLLHVSYTSAHWPMHAHEKDIAKYRGEYDAGFDPMRAARLEKARGKGVLDERWSISKRATSWEENEHKDWDIRCMEVYAAMVDNMDQGIGRIVSELEEQGKLEDTLFVYLQDNGGCAEGYGRRSNVDEIKNAKYEPLGKDGLQTRIWTPMQTRDGRPVRTGPETMPGAEDTFVAYGVGWANASNTPFRGFKHDGYEGGISTPLIVHWPGGIPKSRAGGVVNDPSHLIDLMPTFLSVSGATYPARNGDAMVKPLEGLSLLRTFQGKPLNRKTPLGFEHHGNQALRDGRWKIVSAFRRDQPRKWELYDMVADRTELYDLAAEMPGRHKKMIDQWQAWADRVGVQPWPFQSKK
jgi:arylsulfatase A-like enzyme